MNYAYYPGCSLTGTARRLDRGVKRIFEKLGHKLAEIPDWNCCGAFEYGDRRALVDFSKANLKKAVQIREANGGVVAPCPACYKNLKEADDDRKYTVYHPLELLGSDVVASLRIEKDLKGKIFTPYYGCLLMRPNETSIPDKEVMEHVIRELGGEIEGSKIRAKCCGGNQFFINKWATEKLSTIILAGARGIIVVFCPLCHMALTSFSKNRKIVYFTDLLLYAIGERLTL